MLIPYFVFEILFAVYLCISRYLAEGLTIDFVIKKLLVIISFSGLHTTWFLPCLLLTEIIFSISIRAGKQCCVSVMISSMLIGLLISESSGYSVVFFRSLIACGFFAIGFTANQWWMHEQYPAIVVLSVIIYGFSAVRNGLVSIADCSYGNTGLFILNALLGSFILLQLSIWLHRDSKQTRIISGLEYIGRNSMIVLCTQSFVIEAVRLVDHKLFHSILPQLGYWEGLVFCIIIVLTEIPIIVISRKYFPYLFGLQVRRAEYED